MIVPDVNLLLYATMDLYPQHREARAWWERALAGNIDVGLAPPAVFGFIRIATNGRLFRPPLTASAAVATVRAWLMRPGVQLLVAGPRHMETALRLIDLLGVAGDLTTDVQLAAHAMEHNATLCSADSDFARFPGLRWENPLK
jgi:toxin-antitoxin system PIN domain toxin